MTTLRPLGPSVAFTAAARTFTPFNRLVRASSSNFSCFGIYRVPPWSVLADRYAGCASLENGEDVLFTQNEVVVPVDLHFVAGVLAEQDAVAGLHVEGDALAVVGDLAVASGDDLPALRLFFRRVGNDDAADLLLALFLALDEDAVMQRTDFHGPLASLGYG